MLAKMMLEITLHLEGYLLFPELCYHVVFQWQWFNNLTQHKILHKYVSGISLFYRDFG